MITYITQDVCDVRDGIIVHGCNSRGVMGAGIARAIKVKWPKAFESYKKHLLHCSQHRIPALGTWALVKVDETLLGDVYVANVISQLNYGRQPGYAYASVTAIEQALASLFRHINLNFFGVPIYMSMIGCNLGGLDWDHDVRPIVESLDSIYSSSLTIYVCSL